MKKFRKIVCFMSCTAVILTVSRSAYATNLNEVTNETIEVMESQISDAESERDSIRGYLSNVRNILSSLEQEKTDLNNYVARLDEQLMQVQQNLDELKRRIAEKEVQIEDTRRQLENARETENVQYEFMESYIKFTYEQGEAYYLEALLEVESFADFLNQLIYINAVLEYSQDMLNSYIATREFIELCERDLVLEKEVLDEAKAGAENEQATLEALIEEKTREIEKYETDIANKEAAIREYEADIAERNEIIRVLEEAVAAERRRVIEENGKVLTYDGGAFHFPMASYTRVSDEYGDRIHPTLGVPQFHNGVDLAAPQGTAIYAAYDGIVVAATYSQTMGNYVMIDHGDGLFTIYMHASALYVSEDDVVARGDTIAAVGATGRATGPHLHFSVRKDGSYVSPWNYISK